MGTFFHELVLSDGTNASTASRPGGRVQSCLSVQHLSRAQRRLPSCLADQPELRVEPGQRAWYRAAKARLADRAGVSGFTQIIDNARVAEYRCSQDVSATKVAPAEELREIDAGRITALINGAQRH